MTRGPVMYPTRDAADHDGRPDCIVIRRGLTWWSVPRERANADALDCIQRLEDRLDCLHAARARTAEGVEEDRREFERRMP